MLHTDRRSFLKLMGSGALAASMPETIRRAVSLPAHSRTGTIKDVEHIVILTQENRSFDHYFGSLRGVRGFADPRAVTLPSGRPVWHQSDGTRDVLPYRPVDDMGRAFLPDPPHGWNDGHAAWNGGRVDQWVPNKGIVTMTYNTREDIPFHYALADAFTVCDAYHCSVMGPTDPNRYHLWTGWLGNDGRSGGPVITNAEAGYDWTSYPERLQQAGIDWKVYQDVGVGLDAAGSWGWTGDQPYIGNYGDNALLYLHQYQNAQPGTPLADRAKVGTNIARSGGLFDALRRDVAAGARLQVSWIVAPEAYTEHPNWAPDFGAWYISQVIDALSSNPEVWGRTVLFLNYDEDGGFFDHTVPPTPPATPDRGASTVSIVDEIYPGDAGHPAGPIGLGVRVPLVVVSPWSRGGWVNSQVFDHTSIIRFIEARYADEHDGLIETNITPWRRAVAGDLTSAFDFSRSSARTVKLPSTAADAPPDRAFYPDLALAVPANQAMPVQERGVRPARALPYVLHAHATAGTTDGSVRIDFDNRGAAAAVFHVRSADPAEAPRTYTVEGGRQLSGTWVPTTGAGVDLSVHGPNGFFRRIRTGGAGHALLEARASYADDGVTLAITNRGAAAATVQVEDRYTGTRRERTLAGGASLTRRWDAEDSHGWYDLVVTVAEDPTLEHHLAGHIETGRDSISDPAMGGLTARQHS